MCPAPAPAPPRRLGRRRKRWPLPLMSSGDLVEPLTLVLGLFAKDPRLGHPTLDQFVTGLPNGGGKPDEAVAQALDVIRNGDRTQLAIILGAAVAAGWLLARGRPQPGSAPAIACSSSTLGNYPADSRAQRRESERHRIAIRICATRDSRCRELAHSPQRNSKQILY